MHFGRGEWKSTTWYSGKETDPMMKKEVSEAVQFNP